jgi:diguanylate cyclase (GGDEF)-like protein
VRVLVADDELGSRLIAQTIVEELGHDCRTADNGDEAWRLLQEFKPDVLITDREMPGLDGLTLCRRLRSADNHGYTYVVLVTSMSDPAQVLAGMAAGADDYITKPLNPFDLQTRLTAAQRVTALHAQLAHAHTELERRSRTDPLTGLWNRGDLKDYLPQLHATSERYGRSYAAALCDVDYFKAYNDDYGHLAGDRALQAVADTLREQSRDADRVYRYGGEEFLILLPEQTLNDALAGLDRVRDEVQARHITHRRAPEFGVLTISVGVAAYNPNEPCSSHDLLQRADHALYEAKAAGRNRAAAALGPYDQTTTPVSA